MSAAYATSTDPYIDPISGVLRNKLGITDIKKLEAAEADTTAARLITLLSNPVVGNFDLSHLKAIHKRLFETIYDWAGELRTVEMAKGSTKFANCEYLEQAGTNLFIELHKENLLKNLPDEQYAQRLAHYYSEVNILHPFREGNGRAQRAFFTLLALESGRTIAWDLMDVAKNLEASIAAYGGDESGLVQVLSGLLQRSDT